MSETFSGDLTVSDQVERLAALAKERLGTVEIYTSDAGIDVSGDYNRQEELTARIHLGQTIAGLMSLSEKGCFIVKTYTFTSEYSVALLAVCAALFDRFYITKPLASRPRNSEVYLVGMGFRGMSEPIKTRLIAALNNFDYAKPLITITSSALTPTLESLLPAARQIHLRQQVMFLNEAVQFFKDYRGRTKQLSQDFRTVSRRVQSEWLAEYSVRSIPSTCHLPMFAPNTNECRV